MTVREYGVVIEKTDTGFSAYVPDLPGCISTGRSSEEILKNIREAIELHIEGMVEDGETVPEPSSSVAVVAVASAA